MKINQLCTLIFIALLVAFSSCEPSNPYNTGPAYDVEGNLKIDSAKIVSYLDTAQIDSLYRIHDPSGVVIIVQEEGDGAYPVNSNVVYTNYIGSLMEDGSVFDTNIDLVAIENDIYDEERTYGPFGFVLGSSQVIPGWEVAFKNLRSGSRARIVIPSPYAYQNSEVKEGIPPNSILVFDVDFLSLD